MKKFEYRTEYYSGRDDRGSVFAMNLDKLNKLGEEGWEMCGVFYNGSDTVYHFRKELPDDNKIQLKYKDLTIQATIIKDFGDKAIVLAQDRVSLAFKRNGRWESFTPGFDLLEF